MKKYKVIPVVLDNEMWRNQHGFKIQTTKGDGETELSMGWWTTEVAANEALNRLNSKQDVTV